MGKVREPMGDAREPEGNGTELKGKPCEPEGNGAELEGKPCEPVGNAEESEGDRSALKGEACPSHARELRPYLLTVQSFTEPSAPPLATVWPSGEKATAFVVVNSSFMD